MSMETGKSKSAMKVSRQRSRKTDDVTKSKGSLLEKYLLVSMGLVFFVLFWPSTDWTRPTHIMGNNLLYILLIKMLMSSLDETPRIMVDQLTKLTTTFMWQCLNRQFAVYCSAQGKSGGNHDWIEYYKFWIIMPSMDFYFRKTWVPTYAMPV